MASTDKLAHELISAYLDGELSADEQARVETLLASSDRYRKSLAEMKALAEELHALPGYRLGDHFADRVLQAAGHEPAKDPVINAANGKQNSQHQHRFLYSRRVKSVAALITAAAILLAVFLTVRPSPTPIAKTDALPLFTADSERPNQPVGEDSQELGLNGLAIDRQAGVPESVRSSESATATRSERSVAMDETELPGRLSPDAGGQVGAMGDSYATNKVGMDTEASRAQSPLVSEEPSLASPENGLPGSGFPSAGLHDLLLVVDVQLTAEGWETDAFGDLLSAAQIVSGAEVTVQRELQQALLNTRFFDLRDEQLKPREVKPETSFAAMYLVAPAGTVDQLWRRLKSERSRFANVAVDIAFQSSDVSLLRQLRQFGVSVGGDLPPAGRAAGIAYRLELPASWPGMPVKRNSSSPEPDPLAPPLEAETVGPAPWAAFAGQVEVEVLFVLRAASANSPQK